MFKQNPRDLLLIAIFVTVVIASGGDLLADLRQGVAMSHIIQEAVVVIAAVLVLIWLLIGIRRQSHEIEQLKQELLDAKNQPQPDNKELLMARKQLAEVIAQQFTDWRLSGSEKEVGQCLLKGLSLKEIAAVRGTTEKTVRQQASSIYQKSGVAGRHAFAAWFIEDFL